MKNEIIIIGTGAQAKYALEIFNLQKQSVYGLIALNNEHAKLQKIYNKKVLGSIENFDKLNLNNNFRFILACSDNHKKKQIVDKLKNYSPIYINAIHPKAIIASTSVLGEGVIVNANAIIQPYSKIGNHVMIHAGVIIEHDVIINNFVNIAPGVIITGHVIIKEYSKIFTGAIITPNITIGQNSIVAAASTVLNSFEDNLVIAGTPAKVLKKNE